MNKHQKEVVKIAKELMSVTTETAPLANFRLAKRYVRTTLSYKTCKNKKTLKKKFDNLTTWYVKALKKYQ